MRFSKIIYSLVTPETERVVTKVLGPPPHNEFHSMYREAWTQKQDVLHESMFSKWRDWVQPSLHVPLEFSHQYPTNGASEGIREIIHDFAANNRDGVIHVFEGEYEGFSAYAAAARLKVLVHSRNNIEYTISLFKAFQTKNPKQQHLLLISQPSAFNGEYWTNLDPLLTGLSVFANVRVLLDLTYIGCVRNIQPINLNYPIIQYLVFSLSKPAGAYYHRIGGVLSKNPLPGLFGNKWFKNLMALRVGEEFISSYSVTELPIKYHKHQLDAINHFFTEFQITLQPSNVYLLGVSNLTACTDPFVLSCIRGGGSTVSPELNYAPSDSDQICRVCLTPMIAGLIDPSLNTSVTLRYYEKR